MSPRGDYTGKADAARQYLANLIAADQWQAAKPLDQYKDAQVIRKANAFKVQEQAGAPISNKAARGHADILPNQAPTTPYLHPSSLKGKDEPRQASKPKPTEQERPTALQPPAQQQPRQPRGQRKDVTIIPPPKMPEGRIKGPRDSSQTNTTRFSDVLKELKFTQKSRGDDSRVYFSIWDNRRGQWTKLYVHKGSSRSESNGVDVADLMDRIREKITEAREQGERKTERQALIEIWQEDIEGDVAGEDSPDDLGLPPVFSSFSIHVIGE